MNVTKIRRSTAKPSSSAGRVGSRSGITIQFVYDESSQHVAWYNTIMICPLTVILIILFQFCPV
jgi:hypothetical protein